MASSDESWISDIVNDFIHSSVWLSPIQTFIDTNCACFDYDDENPISLSSLNEQKKIYKQYQNLADSLITSLSEDLKLDMNEVKDFYQQNNATAIDESYERLYSVNDFYLFTEMMKRKNLILQLQALVNIQLEYGLLKETETSDDQVLQLLLKATSSSNRVSAENSSKVLSNSKRNEMNTINTNVNRHTQSDDIKTIVEPKTIDSVPEEVLLEKLKQLTINTPSSVNNNSSSALSSRQDFLKQQRELIIRQQCNQRARELEKESACVRPQSTVNVARKAIETTNKQEPPISNDELEKRRAVVEKLRREVVNKR